MKIVDGQPFVRQVRDMIKVYTDALGRDLSFQNLEDELADPASKYSPPEGEILVAIEEETIMGMVAYHRHSEERCEMKRLFVYPEYRGRNIGDLLVKEIIDRAERNGYREMVLDTLEPMKPAIALYRRNGFEECKGYYYNPYPDVIYLKRLLKE